MVRRFTSQGHRRLMAAAVAGLAIVSLTTMGTSLALFTSTATVSGNTFSAGTVVLETDKASTALVSFTNMAPGSQVTDAIQVSNTGTLALRYAISDSASNTDTKGLKDQLVLTIKSGVTTCTNGGFAGSGSVLYTGDLDSSAGKLVGDAATGADSGDRVLAAAASETLCWNVSLPIGTGNTFQGAATTATITFSAEQTVNN